MSVQLPYICLHVFLLNAKSNKAEIKCYLKKKKEKKDGPEPAVCFDTRAKFSPLSQKRKHYFWRC